MLATDVRILSTGGKKLVRTVGGVTRTYDLIDQVSLFKDGTWRTFDIRVDLQKWRFEPRLGPGANSTPSSLCRPGTAEVILGAPKLRKH